jgi:hypothetical protein
VGGRAAGRPTSLPLTGADCFLRALDAEIRRQHRASHVSQLVLRLGPGFDPAILEKLVAEVARAQPIVRAPIARRFGLLAPVYRLSAAAGRPPPRVDLHERDAPAPPVGAPLPALFARRLNEPLRARAGELLRFDVVRYAGGAAGTDLAASWLHMLFDGSGSERFIGWLDRCYRGESSPAELPDPGELSPSREAPPPLRARADAALAWQRWVKALASPPLRSLAGPPRRTPQALRIDPLCLDAAESARAVASAGRRAGFLTPMLFYLAAAIRAHHAVFRARGVDPRAYLVPLPVNLRARGRAGALFRTHVSLLWFRVLPHEADDLEGLLALLKEQRLAAIRAGHVEGGAHAMDLVRALPARLHTRLARIHHAGELCSFFFAWTGEFLGGQKQFLGAEIRDGFHVAPAPPSPGSCLATSLFDGRLHTTHVHQRGLFSDEERALFAEQLRADLLA